jgi:hypothetical protein
MLAKRLDRWWAPFAITIALYAALAIAKLAVHHFDPSYFVMTGAPPCDPALTPPGLTVPTKDHNGYDGQFYYRLALDPFTREQAADGIWIDFPAHRQQRILYPLVAWTLSRGHPERLPWILFAINAVAIGALASLAGRVARALGRHALTGLFVTIFPGYVFAFARDLCEVIAGVFLVGTLLAARAGRRFTAACLATLAILSRETTIVVPAALFACAIFALRRERSRARVLDAAAHAAPLAIAVAWQLALRSHWGHFPSEETRGTLSPPLVGLARFFGDAIAHLYVLDMLQVALILAFGVAVAWSMKGSSARPHEKLAWVGYAVLLTLLRRESFWDDMCHYLRAVTEYFVLGSFVLLSPPRDGALSRSSSRTRAILFSLWAGFAAFHFFACSDIVPNMY